MLVDTNASKRFRRALMLVEPLDMTNGLFPAGWPGRAGRCRWVPGLVRNERQE